MAARTLSFNEFIHADWQPPIKNSEYGYLSCGQLWLSLQLNQCLSKFVGSNSIHASSEPAEFPSGQGVVGANQATVGPSRTPRIGCQSVARPHKHTHVRT